jgi:CheY-like chemotaxis protein
MSATYMSQIPRPRTVLVVDGDPQWRASTCRAIGSEYPVLAATCGADAVRTAKSVRPDLIVLDVMKASGTDGYQILAKLRRDPATRDMPVIVVSEINASMGLGFGMAPQGRRVWRSVHTFIERSASCECLMDALHNAIGPSFCHRSGIGLSSAVNRTHRMSY